MRARIAALILASTLVPGLAGRAEKTPIDDAGNARGWVAPTVQDKQLLQQHGSRLLKVLLNLRGLTGLWSSYHDKTPGAKPPPNGQLVRTPGLGAQYRRYSEPVADAGGGAEIVNFPRAIDNSQLPCFPPIFYQGELNSCTSVAVTYYQLTHMTGLARGWDQKRGLAPRFSPMWTFNLINGGDNRGAFQSRAYAALLAHGAVSLKDMPYRNTTRPAANYRRWPDDPKLWQQALEYRIEGFGMIQERNVVTLLRRIKLLLVNGHVLTAATGIDGWNKEVVADNPNSRLDTPYVGEYIATTVAKVPGNHCITIVGYNDDLWVDRNGNGEVDPGEKGALKIANSWGTIDWNKGFRWLSYSALYAPRDEQEAEVRQAALYANQVFWMAPARDYTPALLVQVDLPPMYRNEFSLVAGVGSPQAGGDAVAPNFAFNYNGGRFGFNGSGPAQAIHAVLDLTRPARRYLSAQPDIFVRVTRPDGAAVVPRARLIEPATGAVHDLALSQATPADTFSAPVPKLGELDPGELQVLLPAQLDIARNRAYSLPVQLGGAGSGTRNLDVKVFSCNAAVLASEDVSVQRDASGGLSLLITPGAHAAGSCVLTVHASDGERSTNSSIRINLLGDRDATPVVTIAPPQRDGLEVRIPFQIQTPNAMTDDFLIFFDASKIDQIDSYDITGTGANRLLKLRLRYPAPFEVSLSAFDGHFVGSSRIKVGS